MDRNELEAYQAQLSQVDLAIKADPSNTELIDLRTELQELIALSEAALAQEAEANKAKAGPSKFSALKKASDTVSFKAGDECQAKYSKDGAWYPARVVSVGGSEANRVYTVVFKSYNTTEVVKAVDVRPAAATQPWQQSRPEKRKMSKEEEDEREKKKKKNEKKVEVRAQKAKEQQDKQQAWMKFAKKSEKKGVEIAGLKGTSIFKSPDNPMGRVGVTGSGKGMTNYTQMGKHKFAADEETA